MNLLLSAPGQEEAPEAVGAGPHGLRQCAPPRWPRRTRRTRRRNPPGPGQHPAGARRQQRRKRVPHGKTPKLSTF